VVLRILFQDSDERDWIHLVLSRDVCQDGVSGNPGDAEDVLVEEESVISPHVGALSLRLPTWRTG